MKVIVDSSFLIMCIDYGRDLIGFLENALEDVVEIVAPKMVAEELERLSKKRGKKGIKARAALKFLERAVIMETENRESVDGAILELARRTGYPVVTVDKTLARLLRENGVKVLTFTSEGKPHVEYRPL